MFVPSVPVMPPSRAPLFTPVLLAGSLVVLVGFAIRAAFGVFQIPIAEEFGWPRAEFSLAIAIQNLAWGFGQPIFGALAEKLGDRRAIILGAITAVGGGTLRDVLVRRIPAVLESGLYAIPAIIGAAMTVAAIAFAVPLAFAVKGLSTREPATQMAAVVAVLASALAVYWFRRRR